MKALDLLKKEAALKKWSHAYLFLGGSDDQIQEIIQFFRQTRRYLAADISYLLAGDRVGKGGEIKVESVRQIIHEANLSPHGKRRLIIIQRGERLNPSSGNILLKTLEEPPPKVTFLIFSRHDAILPTIKSRCRIFHLTANKSETDEFISLDFLTEGFWRVSLEIEKIIKEEKVDFFLNKLEDQWRNSMLQDMDRRYSGLIYQIQEARKDLRSNVNARLVLENLALSCEELLT